MKSAHWFLFACAFCAGTPSTSRGLGIRIPDQDARATARGNAFTATADNPSAIYYNPAGISFLYSPNLNSPSVTPSLSGGKNVIPASVARETTSSGGAIVRLGVYAVTLGSETNLSGGRGSFDISHRWQPAPNFYATWKQGNSPLTFGLGVYAPYGFGVWYPEDSPIRTEAISGHISYMSINPVVSYQVTDALSVAIGPTFNYGRTGLKRGILPPFFGSQDQFQFEGDGWGVGWNAGVMWRPHPKHSFGLSYRSQTEIDFKGDVNIFVPGSPFNTTADASAKIKFPQNVIVGYSFRPTEKWNLEVNVDWTDWDNLNTVNLASAAGSVALPFNWQSSLFYEFGASYRFDNGVTASLGYIYSENSVPDASFNPVVPDSDRHIFSAGVGKNWNNWDFDLAYQWAHGPQRTINQGAVFDGTYQFDSHAISLSATHRF